MSEPANPAARAALMAIEQASPSRMQRFHVLCCNRREVTTSGPVVFRFDWVSQHRTREVALVRLLGMPPEDRADTVVFDLQRATFHSAAELSARLRPRKRGQDMKPCIICREPHSGDGFTCGKRSCLKALAQTFAPHVDGISRCECGASLPTRPAVRRVLDQAIDHLNSAKLCDALHSALPDHTIQCLALLAHTVLRASSMLERCEACVDQRVQDAARALALRLQKA